MTALSGRCGRADCLVCAAQSAVPPPAAAPICVVCRREPATHRRFVYGSCGERRGVERVCHLCALSGDPTSTSMAVPEEWVK